MRHGLLGRVVWASLVAGAALMPGVAGADILGPAPLAPLAPPPPQSGGLSPSQMEAARDAFEQRQAWLKSAAAVAERLQSRGAHQDLSSAEALTVAKRDFPEIRDPLWQPPKLELGDQITGYIGDTAMRVDRAGPGGKFLVESSLPLWATTASGDRERLSVALQDRGEWLVPENPLAKTSIAKDAERGIEFTELGFLIRPLGSTTGSPQLVGNKAFFANAHADTDWIVAPLPDGIETYWQLRSPESPESFTLALEGPPGAVLRPAADGSKAVELYAGDTRLALIAPPAATDAQGQAVAVSYEIKGLDLVVHVEHRGRDLAYPVLVDPAVYDGNSEPLPGGWYVWTNIGAPFWGGYGGGPFGWGQYLTAGGWSPIYGQVHWEYAPPGESYVAHYGFQNLNFDINSVVCWASGTLIPDRSAWEDGLNSAGTLGPMSACGQSFRGAGGWHTGTAEAGYGNIAAQNIWARTDGTASAMLHVGYEEVWLADDNEPSAPAVNISPMPAPSEGWIRAASFSGTASSEDPGLGVNQIYIEATTSNSIRTSQSYPRGCAGTAASPCSGPYAPAVTFALPEGQSTVRFSGIDAGGIWGPSTDYLYRVDSTAPKLDLTGRLAGAQNRAVSGVMRLDVAGDDTGPGGRVTSGAASLSLSVGGTIASSKSQVAQRLQLDPYDFDPATRPLGPVTFAIDATDVAGNAANQTFDVTVARGDLTTLMEGQRTAKRLVLQAKDLRPSDPQYGAATQVRFQYRRALTDAWQDIPASALRTIDSATVTNPDLPLQSTLSPKVIWDVASTITTSLTEPIYVRGYFGAGAGNSTQDVLTRLDPSGVDTDDAEASIGPGDVDLLTGNFSLASTDVNIDSFRSDLSVTRTYNSRNLAATANGPFGPGWTLGTSVLAAGANLLRVTNYAQQGEGPFAGIATSDGGELIFEEHETDAGYYAELGLDSLKLRRIVAADGTITAFELTDSETADVMRFEHQGGAAPQVYELVRIDQPGSSSTTKLSYEPAPGGGTRVTRMLAPVAQGINCDAAPASTVGCRSLRLEWSTAHPGRLARVWFTAPGAIAGNEVAVAEYAYDASHRLIEAWDPRISPALKVTYRYDAATGLLLGVKPPGENEWQLEYQSMTGVDAGRLKRAKRSTPYGAPGTPEAMSVETLHFAVPVSGAGAPYDMSPGQLAAWSQDDDLPIDATAVFRPDDVPADPPTSYAKATVHYLDGLGREVNVASPGGEIETAEHDAAGHVVRELSAANRARALQSGTTTAEHAAKADELDTDRTYVQNSAGWRLVDELGPLHATRLADGTTANARKHTHIDYDEGKPDQTVYNLPTTATTSALVSGVDRDARTTKTEYDWTLRLPTASVVDQAGLNLRTVTVYDGQGLVLKQRLPRSPATDAPSTRETIYYTAQGHPSDAACGSRPEWANLPCKVLSPGLTTGGLPSLPVTVFEYNAYQQPTQSKDYVDSILRRTVTTGSDAAGRRTSVQTVGAGGGVGVDPPRTTYDYAATTGRLTVTRTPDTTPVRTLTRAYDAVGRLSSYTDADGAVTTTQYDLLGRATNMSDSGGASRTMTYDATTARIAEIDDATLGRIIASAYDADGQLTRQTFQTAGLDLILRYDETGDVVQRTYRKTTNCSSSCDWLDWQAASSIHGQWLSQTGTDGVRGYTYDASGRLTQAQDRPTGDVCLTRTYEYDADSNRTQLRTYPAGTGGACSTTTTPSTQTSTYDEADRANATGYTYDVLGRIRVVPASAVGSAINAEYYTDDTVQSLQQNGVTTTIDRDPEGRVRARAITPQTAVINHYADGSDEPAWTQQGTTTTRNFADLTGDLAAVQTSAGGLTLELSDLHGDVVAEMPNSATASPPAPFTGTDEFGVPRPGAVTVPIQRVATNSKNLLTAGTSMSIGKPSGQAIGDLLVAQVAATGNATITPPSGFTPIVNGEVSSGSTRYKVYYKYVGSSEPGSYGFTFSVSGKHTAAVTAFRSTATTSPIDASAVNSGNSANLVAPSITPTANGDAHLVLGGIELGDFNGGGSLSFPSPLTEEWERRTGTTATDWSVGAGLQVLSGGAGTPTGAVTITNQTGYGAAAWGAVTIAIKPAHSGPTRNQTAYSYLGAKQRNTTLAAGTIEMGARVYVPQAGRFLQVDPVYGGSANDYDYADQDPLNTSDLTGLSVLRNICVFCKEIRQGADKSSRIARKVLPWVPIGGPSSIGIRITARALARLAVKRVAARIERRGPVQVQRSRVAVKVDVHHHAGGPHSYRHLQVNAWKPGDKGKGYVWRSPNGWLG